MKRQYILIGTFVSVIVFGFAYQSYVTMHDTETSAEMEGRLMREGSAQLHIRASSSAMSVPVASSAMPMEDGVLSGTSTLINQ